MAAARDLLQGEERVRTLGAALRDPDVVTGPARLALTAGLSAGWRAQGDRAFGAATTTIGRGYAATLGRVTIAEASPVTAPGTDGQVKFVVENDLPRAVTVVVHAVSSNARLQFTGDPSVRLTVPATTDSPGTLTFRSVTNGTTSVTLTLTTPDGTALGTPEVRAVTVQAGFDAVVAVVLLTLLGLLLALGIVRNVRRHRRPRAVAA